MRSVNVCDTMMMLLILSMFEAERRGKRNKNKASSLLSLKNLLHLLRHMGIKPRNAL